MYKIFLTIIFAITLNAEIVDGVAVVVKGSAITLYEIKKEMQISNTNAEIATNALIRKKLEKLEIKTRKISVNNGEVYEEIKKTAARNNLSVNKFYDAIRENNGLSSAELKEKIKEKLLSQKLYSAIAYSGVSQPSEDEIKAYYKSNEDTFAHPSGFKVVVYNSNDSVRLQEKINNPMFHSPDISTNEQTLPYNKISPELASLLETTPINSFTTIVPDGRGGYMSFYLKEIQSPQELGLESIKNQIINMIMSEQREQVLGDYFARLRHNADIKILRTPK